jgi:pilus assembly protein CpaB
MVTWMEVPQSELLWDAVTRKEDYEGKALSVTCTKGEMITKSKLTEKFNASTEIEIGKQVVTVNVDISTSHSGQIRPGDVVDVYTTYSMGQLGGTRGTPETKTKVVLSRIKVFSIDSIRSASTPGNEDVLAKTVSLLVEPHQAEVLLMASKKGSIHLALRNKNDMTETDVPILTEQAFDEINSTDPDLVSDKVGTNSVTASFTDSEEYKKQQKEINRLNDLVNQFELEQKSLALADRLKQSKESQLPSWKVKIYNGKNIETVEFKEEAEKDATLPEAQDGDAPSTDNNGNGESTTAPEGDQPMNTALRADTGDK